MAFGKHKDLGENKDLGNNATGRYVVHTGVSHYPSWTGLQSALNQGDSLGRKLFAFERNSKNGQFVLIWEKPTS